MRNRFREAPTKLDSWLSTPGGRMERYTRCSRLETRHSPAGANGSRTIAVRGAEWSTLHGRLTSLDLLSDDPPNGTPPEIDGFYLLWETWWGGKYASATYGHGNNESLGHAEQLLEALFLRSP
jgi:hypothetical protein